MNGSWFILCDVITDEDVKAGYTVFKNPAARKNQGGGNPGGTHMGLLSFLNNPDINQGIQEYKTIPGAVLLDVRTPEEYEEGHIPGSRNIPVQSMETVESVVSRKDIPVFVYCYSGARSHRAARMLGRMGYTDVRDLGGIAGYSGKVER